MCQKDAFLCAARHLRRGRLEQEARRGPVRGRGLHPAEARGQRPRVHSMPAARSSRASFTRRDAAPRHRLSVAFERTVNYDIQWVGGFKTALFGGEGLFFATLTGPGASGSSRCRSRASRGACSPPRSRRGSGAAKDPRSAGSARDPSPRPPARPRGVHETDTPRRLVTSPLPTLDVLPPSEPWSYAEIRVELPWRMACSSSGHARMPPRDGRLQPRAIGCTSDTLEQDTAFRRLVDGFDSESQCLARATSPSATRR